MLRALKHEGEKQMPKRKNEEGENVRAIYDVDGLLTSSHSIATSFFERSSTAIRNSLWRAFNT